jgi:hypothetical protein
MFDCRPRFDFSSPIREEVDLGLGGGFKVDAKGQGARAVSLFFQFITGPFWKDVGRCKRCRKYFWNRSGHDDKVYCGRRCASAHTAIRRARERRLKEYESKLAAVRQAIGAFERLSADRKSREKHTWKGWVANAATRECSPLNVTSHFITLAINQNKLKLPVGIGK